MEVRDFQSDMVFAVPEDWHLDDTVERVALLLEFLCEDRMRSDGIERWRATVGDHETAAIWADQIVLERGARRLDGGGSQELNHFVQEKVDGTSAVSATVAEIASQVRTIYFFLGDVQPMRTDWTQAGVKLAFQM